VRQFNVGLQDLTPFCLKDPPFNPHGQKVYTDGKNFITPDVDKHNGGEWKKFDKRGNRTGTYDADLNRIGK
jgi:filamentous hemagglutinin